MRRRLLSSLAALSLVLAALVAAAWVASYRGSLWLERVAPRRADDGQADTARIDSLVIVRGEIVLTRSQLPRHVPAGREPPPRPGLRWQWNPLPADHRSPPRPEGRLGFASVAIGQVGSPIGHGTQLVVPCYAPVALGLIPPLAWAAAGLRRRLRQQRGEHCEACGYDLRGNSQGRACPECGALRAPAPTAAPDA